jgi:hypothetical protein
MRKFLFTFICFTIVISLHAQDAHLKFKGIPIDGPLTEFVNKMKGAGFTHLGTKEGMAALQGDFAGYRSCTVAVFTVQPLNVVSMIGVVFRPRDNWADLESDYNFFKDMLTEKYGSPSVVVEEFDRSPQDNNDKLYELQMNRCTWVSGFQTDLGKIELSIEYQDLQSRVVLRYRDKINTEKVRKQALEDL